MGRAGQKIRGLNLTPYVQGATQANAITANSGGGLGKAIQFGVSTGIDAHNRKNAREDAKAGRDEQKRQFGLEFGLRQDKLKMAKAEHKSKQQAFQLQRQSSMMVSINADMQAANDAIVSHSMLGEAGQNPEELERIEGLKTKYAQLEKNKADLQAAMQGNIRHQTHELTPGATGTQVGQNPNGTIDVGMGIAATANVAAGHARFKAPVGESVNILGEDMDATDPRARSFHIQQKLKAIDDYEKTAAYKGLKWPERISHMRKKAALTGAGFDASKELIQDTAERNATASYDQSMSAAMGRIPEGIFTTEEEDAFRAHIKVSLMPGALGTARAKEGWTQADDKELNGLVMGAVNAELATNAKMTAYLGNVAAADQKIQNQKRQVAADPGTNEVEGTAAGIKKGAADVAGAEYRNLDENAAALGQDVTRAAEATAQAEAATEPLRTATAISAAQRFGDAGLNPSGKSKPTSGTKGTPKVEGGSDKDNHKLAMDAVRAGLNVDSQDWSAGFLKDNRDAAVEIIADQLTSAQIRSAMAAPTTKLTNGIYRDALKEQGDSGAEQPVETAPTPSDGPPKTADQKIQSFRDEAWQETTKQLKPFPGATDDDKRFVHGMFMALEESDHRAGKLGGAMEKVVSVGKQVYGDDFDARAAADLIRKYGLKFSKKR